VERATGLFNLTRVSIYRTLGNAIRLKHAFGRAIIAMHAELTFQNQPYVPIVARYAYHFKRELMICMCKFSADSTCADNLISKGAASTMENDLEEISQMDEPRLVLCTWDGARTRRQQALLYRSLFRSQSAIAHMLTSLPSAASRRPPSAGTRSGSSRAGSGMIVAPTMAGFKVYAAAAAHCLAYESLDALPRLIVTTFTMLRR